MAAGDVEEGRGEQRDRLAAPRRRRAARGAATAIDPALIENTVFCRLAIMLRWVEMAPFGLPVVPDV